MSAVATGASAAARIEDARHERARWPPEPPLARPAPTLENDRMFASHRDFA
jgi:hypothetical protein